MYLFSPRIHTCTRNFELALMFSSSLAPWYQDMKAIIVMCLVLLEIGNVHDLSGVLMIFELEIIYYSKGIPRCLNAFIDEL